MWYPAVAPLTCICSRKLWLTVLWGLILLMILQFARVDKPAARWQIPYLLWVTFALYLNAGVWMLNR